MSMLPGLVMGAGGDVEVQAAASISIDKQRNRFIAPPPEANYYRSLAEVKNKR
jgi:hypothetical protein